MDGQLRWKESVQRVAKSATYMDQYHPGWERRVDLSILDIGNPHACICGQVVSFGKAGGYSEVLEHLDRLGENPDLYAFDSSEDGDAWVALIKQRFDLGILSDV